MENTLDLPPFPSLTWEESRWVGSLTLPAWEGLGARLSTLYSQTAPSHAERTAQLSVLAFEQDPAPPSPEQATAFRYLLDHQQTLRDTTLRALYEQYLEYRQEYEDEFDDDDEAIECLTPDLESPEQVALLVRLVVVHVMTKSIDDQAYFGFQYVCTWDEEHGAGVMMHKDRVIQVGGADSAFLEWIAEQDTQSSRYMVKHPARIPNFTLLNTTKEA